MAVLNDALYYPFIDLPNDSWFRTAILFWDTINPIVPREVYRSMPSNSFLKVLKSNNAAEPIYPGEYANGPLADIFTEAVLPYAENLRRRIVPPDDPNFHVKVHRHKMPFKLEQDLRHMGFLRTIEHVYDWYHLYTPLCEIFMGELARIIAVDKNMTPTTDQDESAKHIFGKPRESFMRRFTKRPTSKANPLRPRETENEELLRKVALKFLFEEVIPTPAATFDVETLLRIKEDNREFLYKFRGSFRTLLNTIRQKQSESEAMEELQAFSDKINADVLRLKELFGNREGDITFSDFGAVLSFDKAAKALATLGLAVAGFTVSPVFYLGVIGFASFEVAKGRREIRKGIQDTLRACEGAYIFKVRQELSAYRESGID